MVQSVFGSLTLGYRPLWGRARRLAGIELYVHEDAAGSADMPHFLRSVDELWSRQAPPLLISPQSRQMLSSLLQHAPQGSPWILVRGDWLQQDEEIYQLVQSAKARGLMLVWGGPLAEVPGADVARCFVSSLLSLPPEGANNIANSVRSSVPVLNAVEKTTASGYFDQAPLSLLSGQMYEGLQSLELARACLDAHEAGAVAGWPVADTVQAFRLQQPQPSRDVIFRLMKAIDQEQSLDAMEQILSSDPVLAYRFLLYTNSAALGLRRGVDSLRRGLVMLGLGTLERWLADQLPHACSEQDLVPLRTQIVLRARLAERLIEAGVSLDLQREMYLCSVFSQLDLLLNEPVAQILRRTPLNERIFDGVVSRTGPYAGVLHMSQALEGADAALIRQLREQEGWEAEDLNRLLLRMLSELKLGMPHSIT